MSDGKKHTTIGVRVDDEIPEIVQSLAKKDERPVASMARKRMIEALEARKLIQAK